MRRDLYRRNLERELRAGGYNFKVGELVHDSEEDTTAFYVITHSLRAARIGRGLMNERFYLDDGNTVDIGVVFPFKRRAFIFSKPSKLGSEIIENARFERGGLRREVDLLKNQGYRVIQISRRHPGILKKQIRGDYGRKHMF